MKYSIRVAAFAVCACLLSNVANAQGLISQYQFNGNLLNSITDPVGTSMLTPGPDGTFYEGTSSANSTAGTALYSNGVDGTPNGALRLDGVDDWIDLTILGQPGESVETGFTSGPGLFSGTVMAWVRFDQALASTPSWLMGSQNAVDKQGWQAGWNGARLEATVSTAGTAEDDEVFVLGDSTDDASWADGGWHHIAFAWDGFVSDGEVYLDGAPLGLATDGSTLAAGNQTPWEFPMAIGARDNQGTLDGFWSGLVDDVRIYAGQLSDSAVATIFNETTIGEELPAPDFDSSLLVDGADFLIWQQNVGTGTTFAEGNANEITGDVNIDGDDLTIWAAGYGTVLSELPASIAAVPEPASGTMLLVGLVASSAASGRRRRS